MITIGISQRNYRLLGKLFNRPNCGHLTRYHLSEWLVLDSSSQDRRPTRSSKRFSGRPALTRGCWWRVISLHPRLLSYRCSKSVPTPSGLAYRYASMDGTQQLKSHWLSINFLATSIRQACVNGPRRHSGQGSCMFRRKGSI